MPFADIAPDLSSADLVILTGDITTAGNAAEALRVIEAIRHYNPAILAVPGNWDGPEVNTYLTNSGLNLHRRHVVREDIAFIGVGAALVTGYRSPNEITEADFQAFLAEATHGVAPTLGKVLVCHQPPAGSQTALSWGKVDLGSHAVRAYIETTQPIICFTGHIHEAFGIDQIGESVIINPGPLWETGYAMALLEGGRLISAEIKHMA